MAAAPDTLVFTGPNEQQIQIGDLLITPTGGTQTSLKSVINGGTVAQTIVSQTVTGTLTVSGTEVVSGVLNITGLETFSATDAIASAGSTQATGTALTTMVNNVATVTAAQGVNLLAAAAGSFEIIVNTGTAAFIGYAQQGSTDTINGMAGSIGVLVPQDGVAFAVGAAAGAINLGVIDANKAGYVANTASAAATLSAVSMSGANVLNVINMTGSLSGGAALTMPTVAAILAARPGVHKSDTFVTRIANNSAGAFSWTLTAGSAESVSGTATIAQGAWRDFRMQFINGTSVVATNVGGGTF